MKGWDGGDWFWVGEVGVWVLCGVNDGLYYYVSLFFNIIIFWIVFIFLFFSVSFEVF